MTKKQTNEVIKIDQQALKRELIKEAAIALSSEELKSSIPGIEYIRRGCGKLKRLCVAVYSKVVEDALPKIIAIPGQGQWKIVLLNSDLPDTNVEFVGISSGAFDDKD